MEILKNFLSLFLQMTGVFVLLTTLWTSRRPKDKIGTPILVFNLDGALRQPIYGESKTLALAIRSLVTQGSDGGSARYLGFRPSFGDIEVIKEFSGCGGLEYYPVAKGLNQDGDERWLNEIGRFAYLYRVNIGRSGLSVPPVEEVAIKRNLLGDLPFTTLKHGYDMFQFENDPKRTNTAWGCAPEDIDVWDYVASRVLPKDSTPKEQANILFSLAHSSKYVNIIQIKNPYNESFGKVHIRISHNMRGTIHLVNSWAEREGFKIISGGNQEVHVLLDELPPEAVRYCIVETATLPLAPDSVEIQTGFLQRLPPTYVKTISIVAMVLALLISVGSAYK